MDEIRVGIVGFGFMGKTHTYGYTAGWNQGIHKN
jgi:hypothetical protein